MIRLPFLPGGFLDIHLKDLNLRSLSKLDFGF